MLFDFDQHNLLLNLTICAAQIEDLEKASGYKIDVLTQLIKDGHITIPPPYSDDNIESEEKHQK